jgi:hypothetical protein
VTLVGLARTPRRVAASLSAAAAGSARAAARLAALGRERGEPTAVEEAAQEAERLARRAAADTGQMLGGGLDRGDVLRIAFSLARLSDRLGHAAACSPGGCSGPEAWPSLCDVVRDATRELRAAIDDLDGPASERDRRLERVEVLHQEGRLLVREARVQVMRKTTDLTSAITSLEALKQLEATLAAGRLAGRAVRHVAIKHA